MKIEKCPFCDKDVAEISNCQELGGCRYFEKCPATEPYVCVVCNMHEGGCGASSGYYDSEAKAIAAWNRRAGNDTNVTTNADRIRSMSDEELAEWLVDANMCERVCIEEDYCGCDVCVNRVTDWLQQPAKEE
jgi:hypothetical protein